MALAIVSSVAVAGCSSGGGGSSGGDGAAGNERQVWVVADSEVPAEVAELLDAEDGISVASHVSMDGAGMAELDPRVTEALDAKAPVLVYAGGTNDMGLGPLVMLEQFTERVEQYAADTCLVTAIPIFRYERGTAEEVAERTKGTRVLEQAASDAGARVASYLDVSLAMDEAGEDFFADGELGEMHPAPRAYERIAAAIAEQVRGCPSP